MPAWYCANHDRQNTAAAHSVLCLHMHTVHMQNSRRDLHAIVQHHEGTAHSVVHKTQDPATAIQRHMLPTPLARSHSGDSCSSIAPTVCLYAQSRDKAHRTGTAETHKHQCQSLQPCSLVLQLLAQCIRIAITQDSSVPPLAPADLLLPTQDSTTPPPGYTWPSPRSAASPAHARATLLYMHLCSTHQQPLHCWRLLLLPPLRLHQAILMPGDWAAAVVLLLPPLLLCAPDTAYARYLNSCGSSLSAAVALLTPAAAAATAAPTAAATRPRHCCRTHPALLMPGT
jgi:hypothetical protein